MSQVLIRNVDASTIDRLKARAQKNGRSLQAELTLILEDAARLDAAKARLVAAQFRNQFGDRTFPDSAELIAEDRLR